jgi:hypothetical protein
LAVFYHNKIPPPTTTTTTATCKQPPPPLSCICICERSTAQTPFPNLNRCRAALQKGKEGLLKKNVVWRSLETPIQFFGLSKGNTSAVFHYSSSSLIDDKCSCLLTDPRVFQHRAEPYRVAIRNKGSPYQNIIGFLDATIQVHACMPPPRRPFFSLSIPFYFVPPPQRMLARPT